MERKFMKGNEAIAEAAGLGGCRFFAGYPITPQSEIPEYLSDRLPEVGGVFMQAESEVAAINMIYGAASIGTLSITSSSSPGISLYSEGMSYLAGAELPAVVVSESRGGPGLGAIQPAQQDYLQATKAMGHGGFRCLVYAPATVQEARDYTYTACEMAGIEHCPVVVLTDGCTGACMEAVTFPEPREPEKIEYVEHRDSCTEWTKSTILSLHICRIPSFRKHSTRSSTRSTRDGRKSTRKSKSISSMTPNIS